MRLTGPDPKLFTPGPTRVPPAVQARMAEPMVNHRSQYFKELLMEVNRKLQLLFKTEQPALTLSASGTGAMEAAITNTLSAQDEVIVVNGGKFGERWREIARAYALTVHEIKVEWGRPAALEVIETELVRRPHTKAILIQSSETSTGICHPVKELARRTRGNSELLLMVDAITSVGVFDVPMDSWGIDVMVTGSQKGLMLPPGLSMIALSEKAWKFAERSTLPRFYFNLRKERDQQSKGQTAFTPAVSLIMGLDLTLDMLLEEGLENVHARHARLLEATRAAATAMGLELAAHGAPSPACSPIFFPPSINAKEFLSHMRKQYQCYFASGQDQWETRVFRIGHLGFFSLEDLAEGFECLIQGFAEFGVSIHRPDEALSIIRKVA